MKLDRADEIMISIDQAKDALIKKYENLIKKYEKIIAEVIYLQKKHYGDAMDLHLAMIKFVRKING